MSCNIYINIYIYIYIWFLLSVYQMSLSRRYLLQYTFEVARLRCVTQLGFHLQPTLPNLPSSPTHQTPPSAPNLLFDRHHYGRRFSRLRLGAASVASLLETVPQVIHVHSVIRPPAASPTKRSQTPWPPPPGAEELARTLGWFFFLHGKKKWCWCATSQIWRLHWHLPCWLQKPLVFPCFFKSHTCFSAPRDSFWSSSKSSIPKSNSASIEKKRNGCFGPKPK